MMPNKKSLDAIVASMERAVAQAKRSSSELLRALRSADSYSRAEVLVLGDADPTRGQLCHHCGLRIPEFADLRGAGRRRVLELIRDERRIMAIRELQTITGCSLRWGKLWVHHAGRPLALRPGPPCPFCGQPLRTSRAQLCVHCGADWHGDPARDPDEARIAPDPEARCYPRENGDE
jgi:hypothetical protein